MLKITLFLTGLLFRGALLFMKNVASIKNQIRYEARYWWSWLRYVVITRFFLSFLPRFLEQQKPHLFLYAPICFGIGIALYFSLRFEPDLKVGLSALIVSLFITLGAYLKRLKIVYIFTLAMTLLIAGFWWAGVNTHLTKTVMVLKETGPKLVSGTVKSMSHVRGNLSVAILDDVSVEGFEDHETPTRIKLRSYHFESGVVIGDRIQVLAKLSPPTRPVIPDGFDFQRHAFFQGIGAVGFSLGEVEVLRNTSDVSVDSVDFWNLQEHIFERLRSAINQRIEAVQDEHIAALSKALITGDRVAIRDEDYEALRSAGLAHMLAISGLHIGLVSGFVFVFLRFSLCLIPALALNFPIKKIAAIFAIFSAIFYMLLAGATIPTQRAAFMTCLVFLAVILDRKAISLRLVALAAFVVLLIAPESLLSASFQLSFAAVVALISFYEWWVRRRYSSDMIRSDDAGFLSSLRYRIWGRPLIYIGGIMLTSLIATFATTLFAIYHFGYAHIYGILGNVLALPIVSLFIMPIAVLGMVLWALPAITDYALIAMQEGLEIVMSIAEKIHALPHAVIHLPQISDLTFFFFVFAFLSLCLIRGTSRLVLPCVFISCAVLNMTMQTRHTYGFLLEDTRSLLMKDGNELMSYGSQPSRFVRDQLHEFYGFDKQSDIQHVEHCEGGACIIDIRNKSIAIVQDNIAYHKICGVANDRNIRVFFTPTPLNYKRECDSNDVMSLDFFDLWRYGSYRIDYDEAREDIRIKSVEGLRGIRPWTTRGQRRSQDLFPE